MKAQDYHQFSYETWEGLAPGWERWRARIEEPSSPVAEWLVRELGASAGDTVLELAAGTGAVGLVAAPSLGERGRLILTDFAPSMVEAARRRGAELGLENVDYRVMDAENLELDTDSVDGVLCRFGFMLMARPAVALAETRRVLRAGGRLSLSVWGPIERNPWAGVGARKLVERGHVPPPEPGAPGPFSLGDEERVRELLEGAGFSAVRIEEVPVRFSFEDVEEFLSWAGETAGPFARAIRSLSDTERDALKAELTDAFIPFAASGRYELPGLALNAVAS